MNKTFVIGDIHGSAIALRQCLVRSGFDKESDTLISLGDLCDGWPETYEVYEEMLTIKHLQFVRGNHDQMMLDWAQHGEIHPAWLQNGGQATIDCYQNGVPDHHMALLTGSQSYLILGGRLFVHAGIYPDRSIDSQDDAIFLWDRALFKKAITSYMHHQSQPLTMYNEVYIGHCPIHRYGLNEPVCSGGIWMMDTGAGWEGRLSMMDIDTKEIFQSDKVESFYPPGSGRGG